MRLFKRYLKLLVSEIKDRISLRLSEYITPNILLREACWARNVTHTHGGKTPLELAFGRRPPDIMSWENATMGQLYNEPAPADKIINELRTEAMRCYLKARHAEDIRHDLAASLKYMKGPFEKGQKVWYWHSEKDHTNKDKGYWLRGIVKSVDTPMIVIDLGTRVIKVNQSLLRRDHDEMSDVDIQIDPIPVDETGKDAPASEGVQDKTLKIWRNKRSAKRDTYELPKALGGQSYPPSINQCVRRVTRDENGKLIADQDLTKLDQSLLEGKLPGGVRMVIQTEFYYIERGDEKTYVPLKKRTLPSSPSAPSGAQAPVPSGISDDEEKLLPWETRHPGFTRRRRSAKTPPEEAGVAHNLLGESLEDFTTEDNQTTFDQALWQCSMTGKINLLELFAGSARISQTAALAGLNVGQPIDLRTGFDLMSKAGQKRVIEVLMSQDPDCVWMAPLCSPWSQWSNMKSAEQRYADRDAVMPMVRFCVQVAKLQIAKGRRFVIENPKDSAIWFTKVFQDLLKQEGVTYDNLDFCAYGLTDPVATNLYYRKSTSLLHNFPPDVLTPLFKTCPNRTSDSGKHHEHQPVEGAAPGHGPRSKISQVYPYRFCKTFADLLSRHLKKPRRDQSTFLIEDILDIAFDEDTPESLERLSVLATMTTFEGDVSTSLNTSLHVSDQSIKDLMNLVNSLPARSEFILHEQQQLPIVQRLTPMCLQLRQKYLPNHVFDRCTVLRGTLGTFKPADSLTSEAYLFVWNKDAKTKELQVYSVATQWHHICKLNAARVSGVLMWLSKDNAGYKPPARTTLKKNPFSTEPPSPPPGLEPPQRPSVTDAAPTYLNPNQPIWIPPHLPQHTIPPSNSVSGINSLGGENAQMPQLPPVPNSPMQDATPFPPPTPETIPLPPAEQQPPTNQPTRKSILKTVRKSKPKPPPMDDERKENDDADMDQSMRHRPRSSSPVRKDSGSSQARSRSRDHDRGRSAPPGGHPEPYSRSRSRDYGIDPLPTPGDDDEDEQPRERSRSRDNSPQRERSRSRDDSPPRERSRSRDDDDYEQPRERSRSRDPSPPRERSRSRDDDDSDSSGSEDDNLHPPPRERSRSRDSSPPRAEPSGPMRVRISSTVEEEGAEESSDEHDPEVDPYSMYSQDQIPDIIYEPYLKEWNLYNEADKMACVTESFSHVRDVDHKILDVDAYLPSPQVIQNYTAHFAASAVKGKPDLREYMPDISKEDQAYLSLCFDATGNLKSGAKVKKRKEASSTDKKNYVKQLSEAKQKEIQSWIDNEVYELVDIRKLTAEQRRNFVTGRWVLTIKRDKDGFFDKCKARWVLRGFLDKQRHEQQTDSPAASRPGFRLAASAAANNLWDLYHMDLKTAFLQGQAYDDSRNVLRELPKEAGQPWYMAAWMKKPAYGLNDAPRRWWNVVDEKLRSYGLVPTRADRCTYVLYHDNVKSNVKGPKSPTRPDLKVFAPKNVMQTLDDAVEYLMDPVTGSNCQGRKVAGIVCLHVDDLFMAGNSFFQERVMGSLRKDFQVGSEDKNDIMFVGQRIRWIGKDASASATKNTKVSAHVDKSYIRVDQKVQIDELEEVKFDKSLKDNVELTPVLHTSYRSVLGQINWLQSRTQFQSCYKFSRCASAAQSPTVGHLRELNKLVRQIKGQPVMMKFWPLKGKLRLLGMPDASYKNNEDKSSQRAHVIFICESRKEHASAALHGSLVDYESHKITVTTQSTTVAELHAFMKCFGTCLFLKGLWADLSGENAEIHMRTDANNLVTTAKTTHAPEQKETIHLVQMLRKESISGRIDDLAHVSSADCLSDCLTKHSAKPDALIKAVENGTLTNIDKHPPFRTLLKHKAFFLGKWIAGNLREPMKVLTFLAEEVYEEVHLAFTSMFC